MTNHTKGPWIATGSVKTVTGKDQWCGDVSPQGSDSKYRGPICMFQSCEHISGITKEEAEANARLVAAVPELFEACASVWAALSDTSFSHLRVLADECRAAITKATGAA